jgi:hypothetical protein
MEDNKIPKWLEKTPYWLLISIIIVGLIAMAVIMYLSKVKFKV